MNAELLTKELIRDEGEVLHAYQDTEGYWTIGVGRLIDKRAGGGITKEEAAYLLANDIRKVESRLDDVLPWWRQLSENRQRVVANMAFNLGVGKLLLFENTLAAMKRGDYAAAAAGMAASKWAKQVGPRAQRLIGMMLEG